MQFVDDRLLREAQHEAYWEGFDAFSTGLDNNPYGADGFYSALHDSWNRGWIFAERS